MPRSACNEPSRRGDSSSEGRLRALDVDCKAHDLDNLYVVDTSFFPSSSAVNPALTAMANALRVGDHLLERLDARVEPESERTREPQEVASVKVFGTVAKHRPRASRRVSRAPRP